MNQPARTLPEFSLERVPDTRRAGSRTQPAAVPLVVFVGQTNVEDELVRAAHRLGAVTLVAPNVQVARAWLSRGIEPLGESAPWESLITLGDLSVDLDSHQACWRGAPLGLTNLELRLLGALADRPSAVMSFADLSERAWGSSYQGDRSMVRSAVQRLRRKLDSAEVGVRIVSVRGIGFRLLCPPRSRRSAENHQRSLYQRRWRPRRGLGSKRSLHSPARAPGHDRN